MSDTLIAEGYAYCRNLAASHYENFPVASWLLPARLRTPVAVIYAFARTADDIADEGPGTAEQRLATLDTFQATLTRALRGESVEEPLFVALADTVVRHRLPSQLLYDLLSAFRQDIGQRRYRDFSELRDYCRRSADPVGRLLLHLAGEASALHLRLSDQVCTSLQLINFLQDIRQDLEENDRVYLPLDEMAHFGVTEQQLRRGENGEPLRPLLHHQLARCRSMLGEGAQLGSRLGGRFGLEIRAITEGGMKAIELLERDREDLFDRPRLGRGEMAGVLLRALF